MRFLPLIACALLFALPAKADKFWLSDPAAQPAGSTPHMIEGVLVSEDADGYHIRIVGGEVVLAKNLVFKIEKDGLTVDTISKTEKDNAEAQALANKERQLQQDIAVRERDIRVAEAAARKGTAKPAPASLRDTPVPVEFDPVLGVAPTMGRGDVQRAAQLAFEQTGDRSYLRALRQLRRMR